MIIIRVQSSEGCRRINIDENESLSRLYDQVFESLNLQSYAFILFADRLRKSEIISSKSMKIYQLPLTNGDMVYLEPLSSGTDIFPATNLQSASTTVPLTADAKLALTIDEDQVDKILMKTDGRIKRKRDEKFCRHIANGCCVHCSPLEPFDEQFLNENNIKYLSFHSFVRKQLSGVDRGKFLLLNDISCKIKSNCPDHLPWPKGICSKCQPSSITLNRQTYRHVDNVMFENSYIVENFLNYWRLTGHQRAGYLYGRYEVHPDTPLGIRATVVAIYEPAQESSKDFIRLLLNDETELNRLTVVDTIAKKMNIQRIGWIFTDLIPDNAQLGTVKYLRNIDTHFLSSYECMMAAYFQNQHPNVCRYASSSNGVFGSKFVTVCVTGDANNQIHMEGYQVSNQCMALVRDRCFLPTKDAPELGYVRKSSDKQYVPDVFYKEKDTYGNDIVKTARPLPVAYLLVNIPTSTPVQPLFTFKVPTASPTSGQLPILLPELVETEPKQCFPIENRYLDGHIQGFDALKKYLQQFRPEQFLQSMSDFHLLIYIASMDTLPMLNEMDELIEAILNENNELATNWKIKSSWATIQELISATNISPPLSTHGSPSSSSRYSSHEGLSGAPDLVMPWSCIFCTYENTKSFNNCEICHLPRS